jgi:hypothetical protein
MGRTFIPKRTDGKKNAIPRRGPPKNVISAEEAKRRMRKAIERNPTLAEGLSTKHKRALGLK